MLPLEIVAALDLLELRTGHRLVGVYRRAWPACYAKMDRAEFIRLAFERLERLEDYA